MFSRSSYHRMIISRVVPELAEVDCYKAKTIIDNASKRLPFKDARNWLLILASIAFSLPFVLLVFLGDLSSKVGLSSWMEFFIFPLVILPLVILVDAVHLRIVRPEILSLLAE
ncbi:hypothetical protein [Undibacterium danionis]|uniref:Uncharacterized protein n=1 Tax=Undibacterium danionis TaxID=1812100 RepID=A0ABV6I9F2_9BURK